MDSIKILAVLFRKNDVPDEMYEGKLKREFFDKQNLSIDFARIEGCNASTMKGVTTIYTMGGHSFLIDMPYEKFDKVWQKFRQEYDTFNLLTRNN